MGCKGNTERRVMTEDILFSPVYRVCQYFYVLTLTSGQLLAASSLPCDNLVS